MEIDDNRQQLADKEKCMLETTQDRTANAINAALPLPAAQPIGAQQLLNFTQAMVCSNCNQCCQTSRTGPVQSFCSRKLQCLLSSLLTSLRSSKCTAVQCTHLNTDSSARLDLVCPPLAGHVVNRDLNNIAALVSWHALLSPELGEGLADGLILVSVDESNALRSKVLVAQTPHNLKRPRLGACCINGCLKLLHMAKHTYESRTA